MCGRYHLKWDADDEHLRLLFDEIEQRYAHNPLLAQMKTGEIFPTNIVPMLQADGRAVLARWGYPKWDGKGHIINARSETANERPMFKTGKPCLLPASGYYEWTSPSHSKRKEKVYFTAEHGGSLYLSGLYRMNREHQCPEFVILTRAADTGPDEIHDRMPVMIPWEASEQWCRHKDATRFLQADDLVWNCVP